MTESSSSCQINLNTGGRSEEEYEKKRRDQLFILCVAEILLSLGSSLEDHSVSTFMAKLQATIRQEDRQLTIIWAWNIVQIFIQLKTIWMVTFDVIHSSTH